MHSITLPQVLPTQELTQVHRILREAPEGQGWVDGRVTSGAQSAAIKNNQQMPENGATTQAARAVVLAALARHPLFLSAALPRRLAPPLFNRYSGSTNAFGPHIDNAMRCLPASDSQGSGYLRTDISCTLFLTEPDAYDGGELQIGSHGPTVKLNAGDALLYPASTVHQVLPVTRGERVACFFWVESLVRSAEQRQLLWDMDMALLSLRARHGESAESVSLTGTYHNLLRQWAET